MRIGPVYLGRNKKGRAAVRIGPWIPIIQIGPWILCLPRDQQDSLGPNPRRSYLYLIKNDFRDVKFKLRVRR